MLAVLGLFAVAIAHPLLDLIGRNAAFLVVHDIGRVDVVLVALGIVFLPPAVGVVVIVTARQLHPRLGTSVFAAMVALLVAAVVLRVFRVVAPSAAAAFALLIAAGCGVAAAVAATHSLSVRKALRLTAIAAPAAVALFLFATPARGLLFPATPAVPTLSLEDSPPIVFVMFDELPLASVLGGPSRIDRRSFPSLAALSDDATFFTNVSGAHASTLDAIPAALSGRYSVYPSLPTVQDHPSTLLSLLTATHRVVSHEPLTQLCPRTECRADGRTSTAYAALAQDLVVLQAHLLAPAELAEKLPPLDQGWANFGGSPAGMEDRRQEILAEERLAGRDAVGDFRRFVRKVRRREQPTLYFHHALLPHRPWLYLPDGRRHTGLGGVAMTDGVWTAETWPVLQAYQLHLAQTQLTDRLLGRLIQRLKSRGLYDEALVVVMADHGGSFQPGRPFRDIKADTFGEIGLVPVVVKAPGQTNGTVDSTPGETIDVFPTLLDLMGVDPPGDLDGRSLLSTDGRSSRTMYDFFGHPLRFAPGVGEGQLDQALRRRQQLFGTGEIDLYRLVPPGVPDLRGQRIDAAQVHLAEGLSVELRGARAYARVRPRSGSVPAFVTGTIRGDDDHPDPRTLAISLNGTIVAMAQSEVERPGRFRVLVDPSLFRPGQNELDVLVVDDRGEVELIAEIEAE